jgi:DNA invertase Pin-like site-specific DNA recombinase
MAIAVYVRVSTIGQNVEGQRREIQRWLDGNGITEAEWYIDKASGATMRRDAFERLQAGIFAGEVQTVIVWRLDRLSRSLRDGVNILGDWCERGVRVVSVTQQLDLSGALGRTLAALLLGLGEMEREAIRERQAAGIAVAKDQGVYKGRKNGTTKATPQRAAELRRRGLNDAEIATALGVSRRTVQRYLRSAAN